MSHQVQTFNIKELFNSGKYRIPIYQRNYAWGRSEILQLIQDIVDYIPEKTNYYINPTGSFIIGGPLGDTGLTGRKIIVDTYGGYCPHGGGSFSGKDPTKVDRSAAYMCRYICKNIVAAGLAKRVQLQVSYAIGMAKPISISINSFNTGLITDRELENLVVKNFDLRPKAIIEKLDLLNPFYCFILFF